MEYSTVPEPKDEALDLAPVNCVIWHRPGDLIWQLAGQKLLRKGRGRWSACADLAPVNCIICIGTARRSLNWHKRVCLIRQQLPGSCLEGDAEGGVHALALHCQQRPQPLLFLVRLLCALGPSLGVPGGQDTSRMSGLVTPCCVSNARGYLIAELVELQNKAEVIDRWIGARPGQPVWLIRKCQANRGS